MANNIAKLRSMEMAALHSGGTIDAKEAKAMLEVATKSKSPEDLAAVKEMFSRDAFESAAVGKKVLAQVKGVASPIAGTQVGNTKVIRSYGSPEGYSNKFQAIAMAQQQGVLGASLAVVKDANNKWHAVQTREPLSTTDIKKGFPIKLTDIGAVVAAAQLPENTKAEKALKATKLAVAMFGVPDQLVSAGSGFGHFDNEKINVDVQPGGPDGQMHRHTDACPCGKTGGAVQLSYGRLKGPPALASATLFHEGQHKADHDVVNNFAEPGKPIATEKTAKLAWVAGNSRESSAYGRAFLATVDTDKRAALIQLSGYLHHEVEEARSPNQLNPELRKAMIAEMKAHYQTLPEELQKQFKQVVAVAELHHPKSSLWVDLFGKEAKPVVSKADIVQNPTP